MGYFGFVPACFLGMQSCVEFWRWKSYRTWSKVCSN